MLMMVTDQVSHTLEEESPLFNFTPGQLLKAKMELIVCLEVIFTMIIIILDSIAVSVYLVILVEFDKYQSKVQITTLIRSDEELFLHNPSVGLLLHVIFDERIEMTNYENADDDHVG